MSRINYSKLNRAYTGPIERHVIHRVMRRYRKVSLILESRLQMLEMVDIIRGIRQLVLFDCESDIPPHVENNSKVWLDTGQYPPYEFLHITAASALHYNHTPLIAESELVLSRKREIGKVGYYTLKDRYCIKELLESMGINVSGPHAFKFYVKN